MLCTALQSWEHSPSPFAINSQETSDAQRRPRSFSSLYFASAYSATYLFGASPPSTTGFLLRYTPPSFLPILRRPRQLLPNQKSVDSLAISDQAGFPCIRPLAALDGTGQMPLPPPLYPTKLSCTQRYRLEELVERLAFWLELQLNRAKAQLAAVQEGAKNSEATPHGQTCSS